MSQGEIGEFQQREEGKLQSGHFIGNKSNAIIWGSLSTTLFCVLVRLECKAFAFCLWPRHFFGTSGKKTAFYNTLAQMFVIFGNL